MTPPADDLAELTLPSGTVAVRYVRSGDRWEVIASDADATWPVELLRQGSAEISTSKGPVRVAAHLVVGDIDRAEVLGRFRAKYGAEATARWFPRPGRILQFSSLDKTPMDPYRAWLAAEFDAAADEYARRIGANPIEAQARRLSVAVLLRALDGHARLLELGSGPGLETVPLLEAGHEVTAVDISPRMLRRLEDRATSAGVRERLTTVTASLSDLEAVGPGPFEGAFSTFGALNCVPDLRQLRDALSPRLEGGAPFLAGIYNRVSLSELGWYGLTGHPRRALARLSPIVRVGDSRFAVDWFPQDRRALEAAFAPDFLCLGCDAIGLVAPPPETVERFRERGGLLDAILGLDAALGSSWPACSLGDQLILRFRHSQGAR